MNPKELIGLFLGAIKNLMKAGKELARCLGLSHFFHPVYPFQGIRELSEVSSIIGLGIMKMLCNLEKELREICERIEYRLLLPIQPRPVHLSSPAHLPRADTA